MGKSIVLFLFVCMLIGVSVSTPLMADFKAVGLQGGPPNGGPPDGRSPPPGGFPGDKPGGGGPRPPTTASSG